MHDSVRSSPMDEVMIGRVVKPHGVRGETVVDATTDVPLERFAPGITVRGTQPGRTVTLTVKNARPHQGRLIVNWKEISDRTAAESLRGMRFFAPPRKNDDGEFYDHDLVGLTVMHQGALLGEVTEVQRLPGRRLLVITRRDGAESLVPLVKNFVPDIDLEEGRITITPPEGLLDL